MKVALFCAALAALATLPEVAAAKPRRIVSTNLCVDLLVLQIAERENIASVSHVAANPGLSPMVSAAEGIPLNDGRVEEIVGFQPDLVVALERFPSFKVALLRTLGIEPVLVPFAGSFDDVRQVVRQVAEVLGETARGERLIEVMDRRLAEAAARHPARRPVAVVYGPKGVTFGRRTLVNDVLEAAGWRNLAAELGIEEWGSLTLERVLISNPDAVIFDQQGYPGMSLAQGLLAHPMFRRLEKESRLLRVPSGYWICGSLVSADAVELLAGEVARLGRGPRP